MVMSASTRGSLCIILQLCFVGSIVIIMLAMYFTAIFYLLLLLWFAFCAALFFRLRVCKVKMENKILHISKGRFFKTDIKVSSFNVSAVRILQTPISRCFGYGTCIIFTSGKATVLWGLAKDDAQLLLQNLCKDET